MRTRHQTERRQPLEPSCRLSAATIAQVVLFSALAMLANPAGASDTNLVLVPDWTGILPLLLVFFVLLMLPANALLFKPIFRVLDEREKRTSGTRKRAQKVMRDAEETLAEYEQAIRDVREEAERDRKSNVGVAREASNAVTAEARQQARVEVERAGRELDYALEESRVVMREQAESIATEAAASVLGRPL